MRALIASLALLSLLAAPAVAAESPLVMVKATIDQVVEVLKNPQFQGQEAADRRIEKIWSIINQRFADQEMARRVMGKHWGGLKPDQRQDIVSLFAELLKRSYVSRLEGYSDEKVSYHKEELDGDYAQVFSQVQRREEKIPIDYRLMMIDGKWMVYDIAIDGVGLVGNFRRQFDQVIAKEGVGGLIQRLREKKFQEKK